MCIRPVFSAVHKAGPQMLRVLGSFRIKLYRMVESALGIIQNQSLPQEQHSTCSIRSYNCPAGKIFHFFWWSFGGCLITGIRYTWLFHSIPYPSFAVT